LSFLLDIAHLLLDKLHPTPAVCGYPVKHEAMKFIRENEPFDRGFFSGPFGFFGRNDTDVLVAIRSCLIRQLPSATSVILYAGAGIVPGSTPQAEYIETAHKLSVISSLFPPSPFSLQGQPNANAAFSAAFVEELIRNGITDFFICPGSRSTPLSVAIVRASRQIHRVGSIRLHSCIDERGAVYRAIGYFHRSGRVPVIVTTSGTAVSNLAPGVSEASVSGTPMILLTADRPYDQIGVGADQAIDQVRAFGCSVRFFRDIQAPSQEAIVPVHSHLSDASHGVQIAIHQRGPVHFNIQFRENLAPDPENEFIRGDPRKRRHHKFDSYVYTDVPGWDTWSRGGHPWFRSFSSSATPDQQAVNIIVRLLQKSRRAILVVGNVRPTVVSSSSEDASFEELVKTIELFATTIGMPIVASCQRVGCALRFSSAATVPFAEYVISHPIIAPLIKPDLIMQLGHPLVGSISSFIDSSMRSSHVACTHVLIHEHYTTERAAPTLSANIVINGQVASILSAVLDRTNSMNFSSNELAPLVLLGRLLQTKLPKILLSKSSSFGGQLTEPQIMLANAQFSTSETPSFFWSNSMPIRDAETFFYPLYSLNYRIHPRFIETAANRGANGIDGIISTAQGYASQIGGRHTTLVIGDVAALHDLNSLHVSSISPLTVQLINNGGGNIFSFLPIRKHGESVGFEEFWSTPQTRNVNYPDVARGMGMQVSTVRTYRDLCNIIRCKDRKSNKFIECSVVGHDENVELHAETRRHAYGVLDILLGNELSSTKLEGGQLKPSFTVLPMRVFEYDPNERQDDSRHSNGFLPHGWRTSAVRPGDRLIEKTNKRNILFLHGWMGDQLEWDDIIPLILKDKRFQDRTSWRFITIDLPGHGVAPKLITTELLLHRTLNLTANFDLKTSVDLEWMASSIMSCLQSIGLQSLDAICGYSLGGRIGLKMKLLAMLERRQDFAFLSKRTKLILLSANAEPLLTDTIRKEPSEQNKTTEVSKLLLNYALQSLLFPGLSFDHWALFLTKWYETEIWSNLHERSPQKYAKMAGRRLIALQKRCFDFELILSGCDSYSNPVALGEKLLNDFQLASNVLYVAGSLDTKYVNIGRRLRQLYPGFSCVFLPDVGHALLTESSEKVASVLSEFLFKKETKGFDDLELSTQKKAADSPEGSSITSINKVGLNLHQKLTDQATAFVTPLSIEFFPFSFSLINGKNSKNGLPRIGWRNFTGDVPYQRERCGIVIQVTAYNSMSEEITGVGEISPLRDLHKESLLEAEKQMQILKDWVSKSELVPSFAPKAILSLEGESNRYLNEVASLAHLGTLYPSVASGLEMALISLSSNAIGMPILESLATFSQTLCYPNVSFGKLPINALMTIDKKGYEASVTDAVRFQSIKVKIGHEPEEDARRIIRALRVQRGKSKYHVRKVRADANRAWDEDAVLSFVRLVNAFGDDDFNSPTELLEFLEEPLAKCANASLEEHIFRLSEFYKKTGVAFALDETVYDVISECKGSWEDISSFLSKVLSKHNVGCAAVVLKPSLLGMELSLRISRLARVYGVSAVFSSSFESGIGLGYIAMLAAISDAESSLQNSSTYAHGLGTFRMISGDILSPPFSRLVNDEGVVDTQQLSRMLTDLSLEAIMTLPNYSQPKTAPGFLSNAISSQVKGRTITLHASLSLPFSDSIAHERFTNLPQMPRWCPWLKSVEFISTSETEWKLNVVGKTFTWRAHSSITADPKGIVWESLSGLRNSGVVEFLYVSENECTMVVLVSFLAPQGIERLFEGIFEDFLRNKLLKWSLEMFRDAVKGDLALERGEVELGDAISDAVEGRASVLSTAFEATLSAFAYNQTSGDFL
jgi:2-succinyl-5-enolpyruvyl-6-hydroxy-3-cyclohexene-1-carboxylate synthase